MPYQPFPVEQFQGLDLVSDPQQVGAQGAIDLLNVDVDRRGRVRSRDGFDNLTASAAATRLNDLAPFYMADGTKQVLVSSNDSGGSGFYRAYSTAGATVADSVGLSITQADFTRFGGPSAEVAYASSYTTLTALPANAANVIYKWDGAAWSAATGVRLGGAGRYPYQLEVKTDDNRLVGAFSYDNYSRVGFSNAGVPETWGANDYVDLTPGDGERIVAMSSWRESVFVFKETKFFVFGGTSTDGTGNPIFNYRPVNAGVGSVGRNCAVATPGGVYFLSRRGIYRTTGGDPVLISRAIDPIFRGGASPFFLGGVLNPAAVTACRLAWHDERLFFAYPSGSATSNDRLAVYDPESDTWLLWDVALNGMTSFRVGDSAELLFTYAAGSNHVGRLSSAYTSDDGVAISSRVQSGFYNLADPGSTAWTRWTRLWGSGSPTVSVITDLGSSDSRAAAVTLGTAPAEAEGYHQQSYQGQWFSHKLSASTAWSVSRLQHDVAAVKA